MSENSANGPARQPYAMVKIAGKPVGGLIECEVENNNYYAADTFSARFSLRGMAATQLGRLGTYDQATVLGETLFAQLGSQDAVTLEILFGFPADAANPQPTELTSFILGNVDTVDLDPVQNTVEVGGRDFTRYFIDTKTTQKWPNQTASEVATALAKQHGLTPKVTATQGFIGNYLDQDQVRMDDVRTQWDLLSWLAQQVVDAQGNPYVVFVEGNALYFGPQPQEKPYLLQWQARSASNPLPAFNGGSIRLSRNLTTLRDVAVVVRSAQHRRKRPLEAVFPEGSVPSGMAPGASDIKRQVYWYKFPNQTKQWCVDKAQSLFQQITQHELKLDVEMPADLVLKPSSLIQLRGMGAPFDQIYHTKAVTRHFSADSGFTMSFSAQNCVIEEQLQP